MLQEVPGKQSCRKLHKRIKLHRIARGNSLARNHRNEVAVLECEEGCNCAPSDNEGSYEMLPQCLQANFGLIKRWRMMMMT